jgi:superfamily II DNA or RNA helicase
MEAMRLPGIVLPRLGAKDTSRQYQRDAATAIRERLEREPSTLCVMPTGTGKTRVGAMVARDWPGRVIWLAHVRELNEQAQASLEAVCREPVGLEQAERYASGERIVVASVQTVMRERGARFKQPSLVIVDEAHHATALSYQRILSRWPCAKVLGLTATPDRADREALQQVFASVAYKLAIEDAIDDGWLVPVEFEALGNVRVDISGVRTMAGDFNEKDLDAAMLQHAAEACDAIIERCRGRKTIVFSTRVERAHEIAARLNALGCSAVAIDGKTESDERADIVAAFKGSNRYQYMANVGIATEGFDAPDVSAVAMLRPTKSHALFVQMAGRGLRPLPGIIDGCATAAERKAAIAASAKPSCLLLSAQYIPGRHTLAGVQDMLGGRYTLAERELAARKISAGETRVDLALADAREEIAEQERRREAALKAKQEAAELRAKRAAAHRERYAAQWETVDPFAQLGVSNPEMADGASEEPSPPASEKDRAWLSSVLGVSLPATLTERQADKLRRTYFVRQRFAPTRSGSISTMKAVPGQIAWLQRAGVNANGMTYARAARLMHEIQTKQKRDFRASMELHR